MGIVCGWGWVGGWVGSVGRAGGGGGSGRERGWPRPAQPAEHDHAAKAGRQAHGGGSAHTLTLPAGRPLVVDHLLGVRVLGVVVVVVVVRRGQRRETPAGVPCGLLLLRRLGHLLVVVARCRRRRVPVWWRVCWISRCPKTGYNRGVAPVDPIHNPTHPSATATAPSSRPGPSCCGSTSPSSCCSPSLSSDGPNSCVPCRAWQRRWRLWWELSSPPPAAAAAAAATAAVAGEALLVGIRWCLTDLTVGARDPKQLAAAAAPLANAANAASCPRWGDAHARLEVCPCV